MTCRTPQRHSGAGPRRRPDVYRNTVRCDRRNARRSSVFHRHVRLSGDVDRPQLPPPDRGGHRPADRQHRVERGGRRKPRRQDLGRGLRGARSLAASLELAGHRNLGGRTGPATHRRDRRHRHPRGGPPPAQPRLDEGRRVLRSRAGRRWRAGVRGCAANSRCWAPTWPARSAPTANMSSNPKGHTGSPSPQSISASRPTPRAISPGAESAASCCRRR